MYSAANGLLFMYMCLCSQRAKSNLSLHNRFINSKSSRGKSIRHKNPSCALFLKDFAIVLLQSDMKLLSYKFTRLCF